MGTTLLQYYCHILSGHRLYPSYTLAYELKQIDQWALVSLNDSLVGEMKRSPEAVAALTQRNMMPCKCVRTCGSV